MIRSLLRRRLVAVVVLGMTAQALAQSSPTTSLDIPSGASVPAPAVSAAPERTLRHLANSIEGFRLSGEVATAAWPVYLTERQATAKLRFRIGYLAAISVMPERSTLRLTINDVEIGQTPILAASDPRMVEFDVPDSVLQPGFNAVRISASQRHRVDCSLAATYELWTQIDPSQTGFLLPGDDPGVSRTADLAALPLDARGALPIRAVLPEHLTKGDAERVIRAVQAISLAGRITQPLVDFGPPADGREGLNLVLGTSAEVSAMLGAPVSESREPRVIMQPAQGGRRATLIVTGQNNAEVDEALGQIAASVEDKGSPAGLRAAALLSGYPMQGGQRVTLRDVGLASQEFGGRLFRAGFNIMLPPDFYPADYGKATLDLAGGYAAGMTRDAQLIVRVNGNDTTSIRLPKGAGDVYDHNPLPVPLGSLRPGLNRIEVEAQLPTPGDAACDVGREKAEDKRFLLLDTSEFELPRIARIARSPDLAVSATGGFPFVSGLKPAILVVPSPDKDSLGAAATIATQFAIAAGRPIDFRLETAVPPKGAGPTLVVGAVKNLDASFLGDMKLQKSDLDLAWRGASDASGGADSAETLSPRESVARNRLALQRNVPTGCPMARPAEGFAHLIYSLDRTPVGAVGPRDDDSTRALQGQWSARVNGSFAFAGVTGREIQNLRDWSRARYAAVADLFSSHFGAKAAAPIFTPLTSLAIAQSDFGDSADDVVTLVTAANTASLSGSVACLVDPRVWRNLAGRVSSLSASEGSIKSLPAESAAFISTQPTSIANMRLIAAGWLSLNANAYVCSMLLVMVLVAFCTLWLVRNVGRRVE